MIEKTILDYLKTKLSVPVVMEIPATIAVQSYAPTMYGAAALNEEVKEAMLEAISEDEITKVGLNSDYNFTDTSQKRYR